MPPQPPSGTGESPAHPIHLFRTPCHCSEQASPEPMGSARQTDVIFVRCSARPVLQEPSDWSLKAPCSNVISSVHGFFTPPFYLGMETNIQDMSVQGSHVTIVWAAIPGQRAVVVLRPPPPQHLAPQQRKHCQPPAQRNRDPLRSGAGSEVSSPPLQLSGQ